MKTYHEFLQGIFSHDEIGNSLSATLVWYGHQSYDWAWEKHENY